jgi:formylglycine-generating enzyme required for sulfatase activity
VNDRGAHRHEDDLVIQPADFRPADPRAAKQRPRIRPASLLVVAALALLGAVAAFMFLGQPVQILVTPEPDSLSIDGGPSFALGERFLLLPGDYRVRATLTGHHDLDEPITVVRGDNPTVELVFRRLPGRLVLTTTPVTDAEVRIDGEPVGRTPLRDLPVEPGTRRIAVSAPRYLAWETELDVEGMEVEQTLEVTLEPGWADVAITSTPPGAAVLVDGEAVAGQTPLTTEILAGEREVSVQAEGYKPARRTLAIEPGQSLTLEPFELEKIDGLLAVVTRPAGATVTVDGAFRGRSPVELELAPGRSYRIDLFKAGHERVGRSIRIASGEATRLDVALPAILGELRVRVAPAYARLFVDGVDRGPGNQVLSLAAVEHSIEIRKPGYVPYRASVTPRPGFPQEIELALKTVEQARIEAIKPEIVASSGQKLLLLRPTAFTMGASRREPGRRANEVLREVTLTRPFYLATHEVSNAQFRAFAPKHDSGSFEDYDLDDDDQPAVNLSWFDAVRYCNWLSRAEGLPEVYVIENGEVVGFDADAIGYRLPTEAEWAWAARYREDGEPLRFPWGDERVPPEDRMGNYADRAAANLLARSIPEYVDGNVVTAPVGSYAPNARGLFDMGGNVAEWINDFYAASAEDLPSGVTDPLGPSRGDYHVIRGSSWMHGQLVDLRLSFRDYGTDGRPDVGLRIARWLE